MTTGIDDPATAALALRFLRDDAGLGEDALAAMLGVGRSTLEDLLSGRGGATPDVAKRLRAIAATQSLLLSGYTPGGAVRWLEAPCDELDGRTPVDEMIIAGPAAIPRVLGAAYARIAS